jgi:hypothetical protein
MIGDDNEGSAHAGAGMPQQDGVVIVPSRHRCPMRETMPETEKLQIYWKSAISYRTLRLVMKR